MSTVVDISKAETHLLGLLEQIQKGEEIVLAKEGKPCARLAPLAHHTRALGFVEAPSLRAFSSLYLTTN